MSDDEPTPTEPDPTSPDPDEDHLPPLSAEELFPTIDAADHAPRRTGSSRRGAADPADRWAVPVLATAAALAAAFAPTAPTGLTAVDVVLRAAFAAIVVLSGTRARRWSLVLYAGAVAAASWSLPAIVPAWIALVAAVVVVAVDIRRRWLGAAIAAVTVTASFHLGDIGPSGTTAFVGVLAALPLMGSAYRRLRRRQRRRIRRAAAVGLAGAALATLGGVAAAWFGASAMQDGLDSARAGVASAKEGERDRASGSLESAVDDFGSARTTLDAWYAMPARAVPLVGYQVRSLSELAAAGHQLTTNAADVAERADYHRIDLVDGRIDLEEIRALDAPLGEIESSLDRATARVDAAPVQWLAPPLKTRYDALRVELTDARREAATAHEAVRVAPGLLGGDGPRRYFVAFTTPAESRGLGGFLGSWAELTATDGRLELTRTGTSDDLAPGRGDPERTLSGPPDYLARYSGLEPQNQVRDVTLSPDFPSVAEVLAGIYPQTRVGAPVDGVLAMDPYALAAMLRLTGPIQCTSCGRALSADNAAQYLLRDQYLQFDDRTARVDALDEAARTTFDKFIGSPTIRPAQLASVLGPMVAQHRLLGWTTRDAERSFLDDLGMTAPFRAGSSADFFSLITQNGGNNKIDAYLRREVTYDATVDPGSGEVTATATIVLRNDAPAAGLPDYVIGNRADSGQPDGVNWTWFNFYSPHQLVSATLDDRALPLTQQDELGVQVYQSYLAVPSQGSVRIVLQFEGDVPADARYSVAYHQQPTVNPDDVRIVIRPAAGWRNDDAWPSDRPRREGASTTDGTVTASLEPTG